MREEEKGEGRREEKREKRRACHGTGWAFPSCCCLFALFAFLFSLPFSLISSLFSSVESVSDDYISPLILLRFFPRPFGTTGQRFGLAPAPNRWPLFPPSWVSSSGSHRVVPGLSGLARDRQPSIRRVRERERERERGIPETGQGSINPSMEPSKTGLEWTDFRKPTPSGTSEPGMFRVNAAISHLAVAPG